VLLPTTSLYSDEAANIRQLQVTINGVKCSSASFVGQNEIKVRLRLAPSGSDTMLQPAPIPSFTGGWYNTSFTLPSAFLKQLALRQSSYPVNWTAKDEIAAWLVPSRLLLHPFIGKPNVDNAPRMFIDNYEVLLAEAFNSRGAITHLSLDYLSVLSLEPFLNRHTRFRCSVLFLFSWPLF